LSKEGKENFRDATLDASEVGEGKIEATVADSNIVQMEQTYNNNIRSVGPLGDVVEIGWMMRQNQSELKGELDDFVKKLYPVVRQCGKGMLLLSKRDIAKKARYGYCRCEEPVNYVSQIQNRYDHYVQIVPMREVTSR